MFENAEVRGCLFHLSQSIYRKILNFGYQQAYQSNDDFSMKIRSLTCLALIPVEDVVPAFEEITEDENSPDEIIIVTNYIGIEIRGRGHKRRRMWVHITHLHIHGEK